MPFCIVIILIPHAQSVWHGIYFAFAFLINTSTATIVAAQYYHKAVRIGTNVRSSLISLLYQGLLSS